MNLKKGLQEKYKGLLIRHSKYMNGDDNYELSTDDNKLVQAVLLIIRNLNSN